MRDFMAVFSDLPPELRMRIWALPMEPRIVHVHIRDDHKAVEHTDARKSCLRTSTPVPISFYICRESRYEARKTYSRFQLSEQLSLQPYIWVDLDKDIVDIGDIDSYDEFKYCGSRIRRLQLTADNLRESWYYFTAQSLTVFGNVKQCFIVAADDCGWEGWWGAYEEHSWPCRAEDIWIIDPERSNKMIQMSEMEGWMNANTGGNDVQVRRATLTEKGISQDLALYLPYGQL